MSGEDSGRGLSPEDRELMAKYRSQLNGLIKIQNELAERGFKIQNELAERGFKVSYDTETVRRVSREEVVPRREITRLEFNKTYKMV